MRWTDAARELVLDVACSSDGRAAPHRIRWVEGEVRLDQHPDVDAELALVAFGGEELPCVALHRLWNDAIRDGGFVGEWAEGDFDAARRWWLTMALERMRTEGFHEFLRDLPLPRARRMGQFLTAFPDEWIDRAACHVADAPPGNDRVLTLLRAGAARRLRHAFALAVGGQQVPLGAAALVPLAVSVSRAGAGEPECSVEGRLAGRNSWAQLAVSDRWLPDVWATGRSVVDGHLVLAVRFPDGLPGAEDSRTAIGSVVVWRPQPGAGGSVGVLVDSALGLGQTLTPDG
ncbi:MAG: hypothetical protein O3C27_12790 [Actinomycetota bacterium]|nr:hypothetical protein [Actinomycetota bacterium]